jgi:hypothetical protein
MKYFILLTAVFLQLSDVAHAARFSRSVYFRRPAGAPEKLYMHIGKKSVLITPPSNGLSEPEEIESGDLVVGFTSTPLASNAPWPAGLPTVKVPQSYESVIFAFFPDEKNKVTPIKVEVLDSSFGNFKPGQMILFNQSRSRIYGKVGDTTLDTFPGKISIMDKFAEGKKDFPVTLYYMMPKDPKAKCLCNTSWLNPVNYRMLLFAFSVGASGTPEIMSITDYSKPEPVKKAD